MRPLKYSASTNKGLHRSDNEDSFLSLPARGLWVVADGMGGHEAGEVASAIVRESLETASAHSSNLSDDIQQSHQAVLKAVTQGIGAEGMGSTVVALKSHNHDYEIGWVGDSRAYLWSRSEQGGQLQRLTTDHSYVQMLLATGAISEEELEHHPDKNVITQCIGSQELPSVKVDTVSGVWQQDQWILLCSDGLTDEVNDEEIARILCASHNTREAVDKLMKAALDHGGHDNITIQVIQSPLSSRRLSSYMSEWIPRITGKTLIDALLYCAAGLSLVLLLFWILN